MVISYKWGVFPLKKQLTPEATNIRSGFGRDPDGLADSTRILCSQEHGLSSSKVSDSALKVVVDLQNAGYAAEVVGGCVRDLLLGFEPKDFDVVTNARPDQVRKLFRRARVVGRRFRLVHIRIGRSLVEVSTYRAVPKRGVRGFEAHPEQGRILEDNVFGTRNDDASRRDFSINALYYDPVKDVLIDYLDGFSDVQQRFLRVIGEPLTRFKEDPVRMLRAVRFVARLDLKMDSRARAVMSDSAYLLRHVPAARLLDEVIKVFHCGRSHLAFRQLQGFGFLSEMFPQSARAHSDMDLDPHHGLITLASKNTDERLSNGRPVISAFLFAVILWRAVSLESERNLHLRVPPAESLHRAIRSVINNQQSRVMIPRRIVSTMSDIWNLQRWLQERRPRLIFTILSHRRFRAAYDLLILRILTGEVETEIGSWWTRIQEIDLETRKEMIGKLKGQRANRRRRRPSR